MATQWIEKDQLAGSKQKQPALPEYAFFRGRVVP
jgi:hypothetical protein